MALDNMGVEGSKNGATQKLESYTSRLHSNEFVMKCRVVRMFWADESHSQCRLGRADEPHFKRDGEA